MRNGVTSLATLRVTAALTLVAIVAALAADRALAQPPAIVNGRVDARPAESLAKTFRAIVASQQDIGWIGYAVPVVAGDRTMCCYSGTTWTDGAVANNGACCGSCALEPSASSSRAPARGTPAPSPTAPVKLEGPDTLVILFRVVNRQVERLRTFSEQCQLDAGGRSVVWLTGVIPAESIALLEAMAPQESEARGRVADGAVSAIALHRDSAADAALERLIAPGIPATVRAKVPFWLGQARGRSGLAALQRLIRTDASSEVRKKSVFGISQSREPEAVAVLIDTARTHADANVRGEAIFWLAQKAGSKAAAAITERIEQDPETEVKKRAVFALSQLPKDEGVPLLIQVARTHTNPVVKKQAMFWLGQSKDPRALDFFAEILR